MTIPSPLDVLRVLPKVGFQLLMPAMVVGAFLGSLCDLLLANAGYPLAKVGAVLGPVVFALAINLLERLEAAHTEDLVAAAEAYRLAENAKRQAAARQRGELVKFED